jgi:hypothetical protein
MEAFSWSEQSLLPSRSTRLVVQDFLTLQERSFLTPMTIDKQYSFQKKDLLRLRR